tara:strand:+ start:536 stop:1303 length:768 start_codon:yes stop_codon:yes gene_type:complete
MTITLSGTSGINTPGVVNTAAQTVATTLAVTGVTTIAAGSAAAPALVGATGGATTGLWFPAASTVAFANAGVESARFDSGGNLLVGTTTASGLLTVKGAGATSGSYSTYVTNSSGTVIFNTRNDGYVYMPSTYSNTTANAANFFINTDGSVYRSTSSLKYKTDVQNSPHGLAELLTLRSVTYKGKSESDADKTFGGLIAEEIHDAGLTEFVQYADDGSPDALAYGNMVSLCIKSIQEQQAIIESLTARITALEAK